MIRPAISSGRFIRKSLSASVPPVEAPTAITFSVVSVSTGFFTAGITTSAVYLGFTSILAAGAIFFIREDAAARTASVILILDSSRNSLVPIFGFVITSTAPHDRALNIESDPLSARLEHIITGMGCCVIIL